MEARGLALTKDNFAKDIAGIGIVLMFSAFLLRAKSLAARDEASYFQTNLLPEDGEAAQ